MTTVAYEDLDIVTASLGVTLVAVWLLIQSFFLLQQVHLSQAAFQIKLVVAWITVTAILTYAMGLEAMWITPGLSLAICISLMHPTLAATQLIMFFILRPWEFNLPGGEYVAKIPIMLIFCSLISLCVYRVRVRDEKIIVGLSGFFFALLMGWLMLDATVNPSQESEKIFSTGLLPLIVIISLILQSVTTRQAINAICGGIALSVVATMAVSLARFSFAGRLVGEGMWANSNDMASLGVVGFALFVAWAVDAQKSTLIRVACVLCAAAVLFAIVKTQSRSAFAAVGCIGLLSLYYATPRLRIGLIIAMVLVGCVFLKAVGERSLDDREGSEAARFNYVVAGFRMLKTAPVIGVGLGQYPALFDKFSTAFIESGFRTAHSSFILVMAEAGSVGLLCLLLLTVTTLYNCWLIRDSYPELVLSFWGYFVMFSTLSHAYLFFPYLIFLLVQNAALITNKRLTVPQLAYA